VNDDFLGATGSDPISSGADVIPSVEASLPAATALAAPGAQSPPLAVLHKTFRQRLVRELLSWIWVALAFFLITGTMVQARVIPSASMEATLLIGDHLLMSRFGYDIGLPFTRYHLRLWREPRRQQVVIFHAPLPDRDEDFIKRLIGMPGDNVQIRQGRVFVNGEALSEPYRHDPPNALDNFGPVTVPSRSYFVLGDNREDSWDSRDWGFVPESNIIGTPVVIYMSVQASEDAWQPGQVRERIYAYANALLHPRLVRWRRLLTTF
jgi:signal peptidase I